MALPHLYFLFDLDTATTDLVFVIIAGVLIGAGLTELFGSRFFFGVGFIIMMILYDALYNDSLQWFGVLVVYIVVWVVAGGSVKEGHGLFRSKREERDHERSMARMRAEQEHERLMQGRQLDNTVDVVRIQTTSTEKVSTDRNLTDVQIAAIQAAAAIQVAQAQAHIGSADYRNEEALKLIDGLVAEHQKINEIAEEDPLVGKQVMGKWHKVGRPERASDI